MRYELLWWFPWVACGGFLAHGYGWYMCLVYFASCVALKCTESLMSRMDARNIHPLTSAIVTAIQMHGVLGGTKEEWRIPIVRIDLEHKYRNLDDFSLTKGYHVNGHGAYTYIDDSCGGKTITKALIDQVAASITENISESIDNLDEVGGSSPD